jgi:UDP-N-acetyl-D-glucosamine dehydrogenase
MTLRLAGREQEGYDLFSRIRDRTAEVAVVGLGYVGLPLATAAATAGFPVTGIDTDPKRVGMLARGMSGVLDVPEEVLEGLVRSRRFRPTADFGALRAADVVVVCVPTPLRHEMPDLSHLEAVAGELAATLRPGQLVILESTTYPGTTEELFCEILEQSGLEAGRDFSLGFSPERIDPGNDDWRLENVPKIVGGIDQRSADLMEAFYGTFIQQVHRVSSPRVAEMAKLLENTYRHVNIALVNELALLSHELGVDVWEVIEAAGTKPFGFQRFYPGPGWGGHCIPVDPAYLSWRVRQMGQTARFVELAREINHRMRGYVVERVVEYLNDAGKSLKGATLLVLGVTYKADVADIRESPALEIISRLCKAGAHVGFHDPYIGEIAVDGSMLGSVELTEQVVSDADVVLVLTAHSTYDWAWIAGRSRLIFDTRNALNDVGGRVVRL